MCAFIPPEASFFVVHKPGKLRIITVTKLFIVYQVRHKDLAGKKASFKIIPKKNGPAIDACLIREDGANIPVGRNIAIKLVLNLELLIILIIQRAIKYYYISLQGGFPPI